MYQDKSVLRLKAVSHILEADFPRSPSLQQIPQTINKKALQLNKGFIRLTTRTLNFSKFKSSSPQTHLTRDYTFYEVMPTLLHSNTSSGMQLFASKKIHLSGFSSSSILQHTESLSSKSHGICSCGVIFTTPCRLRILCSMFSRCYCSPLWRILSSSSHRIPPDSLTAFSNMQNTSNRSRTLNGEAFSPVFLNGNL